MIKDFDTYIKESRLGRIMNNSFSNDVRREDGKKYVPSFCKKEYDGDFFVVINHDTTDFEDSLRRFYESSFDAGDCQFDRKQEIKTYHADDNIFDFGDSSYAFAYTKCDNENNTEECDPITYEAYYDTIKHLLDGIEYDHHDQEDYFIVVDEREHWNVACMIDSDKYGEDIVTDVFDMIKDSICNRTIEGCDVDLDDYEFHSYNNYGTSYCLKCKNFDNLLWAGRLRKIWLELYDELKKQDDIVEYMGLGYNED